MKKIAVTGFEGQIGSRLVKNYGYEPLRCDVTNRAEVEAELVRVKPDVVLHLAAQTSVDWCESHYEEAVSANVYGTNIVCEVAEDVIGEGKVVLLSSDMVFDGNDGFYDEDAEPNPVNVYGLTKVSAELVARLYQNKIIRISRCFDSKSKDIKAYLDDLRAGKQIFVPQHIFRTYCHLDFVAEQIHRYATRFDDMPEILHLGGENLLSFHDLVFALAYSMKIAKAGSIVGRGEDSEYTPRPHRAGLNVYTARNLLIPTRVAQESVGRFIDEIK